MAVPQTGVKISVLRVIDPHSPQGTQQLGELFLNKKYQGAEWTQMLPVKFRHSLMFVFDPLDETPVTSNGVLLDEVESYVEITFKKVCPLGEACRDISPEELTHRGPTGQLSYVYRFPADFRISELPREAYWRLLPPLGPPAQLENGETANNSVVVQIHKKATTETPVHIRVRCESMASQHAGDGHVCPLGTILDEIVLEATQTGYEELIVSLPEPFLPESSAIPEDVDCWDYPNTNLQIFHNEWGSWTVHDGVMPIALLATKPEAEFVRKVGEHFEQYCMVGPRPAPQNEVHDFLFTQISNPDAEWSWPEIRSVADCISYSPYALWVEPTEDGRWLLRSGLSRLMVVSEQDEAELAMTFAQGYSQLCFGGRGNNKTGTAYMSRHRDYVVEYFDAPVEGVIDPSRVLVEVDGENGVEVPPTAVDVDSRLMISSLREVHQELLPGRPPLVYESDEFSQFNPDEVLNIPQRTLYRVHPARQLRPFRVEGENKRLVILATLVKHPHPLQLSLTGDHFESAGWQATVALEEWQPGASAVTYRYELSINAPGLYYLRGYTEASFDRESSVRLTAYFETCEDAANILNCQQEPVFGKPPASRFRLCFRKSRTLALARSIRWGLTILSGRSPIRLSRLPVDIMAFSMGSSRMGKH